MSAKSLLGVSVSCEPDAEDAVTEVLRDVMGQTPSAYTSLKTGVCTVTVYLQKPLQSSKIRLARLRDGLDHIKKCGLTPSRLRVQLRRVKNEDWAEAWKRHFRAFEVGSRLLVKPTWSRRRPRRNQSLIVIDPGLSFGTGQHPTTAFCLEEIVRVSPGDGPKSFLDLGSGSGILAIAAVKLGYSPVHAVEFDRDAIRVSKDNAALNRVAPKIHFRRQDVRTLPAHPECRYSLVCANLISDLLVSEKERITAQLGDQGTLVLAGILTSEFTKVQQAYEATGLRLRRNRAEKEWRSGSFARKSSF